MTIRTVALGIAAMYALSLAAEDAQRALLAAYKTAPQGYPSGKDERGMPYAQPDSSAPFRWHFYNDDAIERADSAQMKAHVQAFNALEGASVLIPYKHSAKFSFVTEHVTEGKQALKIEFDAMSAKAGTAALQIAENVGPTYSPSYNPERHDVAAYWCHYRWVKFDAFNPLNEELAIQVDRVPMRLPPGASVVAIKTADAVGWTGEYCAINNVVEIRPPQSEKAVTFFVDNVRVEQEVPKLISEKGRLFHFAPRWGEPGKMGAPLLWPGFTCVDRDTQYDPKTGFGWTQPVSAANKRQYQATSFRSVDNGFVWGCVTDVDSPFRVDLPKGRYGIWFLPLAGAGWGELNHADKELKIAVNGKALLIRATLDAEAARRMNWAGEAWDWRPGSSLWSELVWPLMAGPDPVHYVDNTEGNLSFEFPTVRAVVIFPEADKDEALKEIARLKLLLAESWDVSHAWIKGPLTKMTPYIGAHEEAASPEIVPAKLQALKLAATDYQRGFILFQRNLCEPFYADTIPDPDELKINAAGVAVPGMSECITVGLLPLGDVKGVRIAGGDFTGPGTIPAGKIDIRVSRYQHKTMEYGHHNHGYNIMEQYLVARPELNLYRAAARRIYVDVSVPLDAKPGVYTAKLSVKGPAGSAEIPLTLQVVDAKLAEPPVKFITEAWHPELAKYGFNLGLDQFKEKLPAVLAGSCQGFYSHEWGEGRKKPDAAATPEIMDKSRAAGEPFWIADQQLHAKEQSGRFTFGFWFWRTGANGRLTAAGLGNSGQRGHSAYHTAGNGNCGNIYRIVIDSLTAGKYNPSRDLMLMREGIDDCRLIYTLDAALRTAPDNADTQAARKFREELFADLKPELKVYYDMRAAAYSEDLFIRAGNPWNTEKFSATRKTCAEHISRLQKR